MTAQHHFSQIAGSRMANVDASDDPDAQVRYLDLATRSLERLIRELIEAMGLQPGDRVLDVGCGTGDAVLVMAELVGETGKVRWARQ